jgi:epoxide hydrolase-like predicted phosphatase
VSEVRALVVDWGGVLTSPLGDAMRTWCSSDGIDYGDLRRVIKEWNETDGKLADNPVHALERGDLPPAEFERQLADRLCSAGGPAVDATGLIARMFAGFSLVPAMTTAVRAAKSAGFGTALLSNSWGNLYPREGWDEMFDAVVISGEVRMRKPDAEIFRLTAERLAVEPDYCVFVDDLMPNIRGAEDVGMVGVHHVSPAQTVEQLEGLLGTGLR